jgi:hypothetical protein
MVETKEEKLQEEIQKQRNIPLILESYNDIFSDFDPRPFSERAISDDFLGECKRATRNRGDSFELILSMPRNLRVINDEFKIKKRLREHFKKHFVEKQNEIKTIQREGWIWVILGIFVNIGVVSGLLNSSSNFLHTILGIFEVPSWFLIWEGLGKILMEARKLKSDHEFYKKMVDCQITFKSY